LSYAILEAFAQNKGSTVMSERERASEEREGGREGEREI
jgi:hypothetical protein